MPGRIAARQRRTGPAPFSSAWIEAPAPPEPEPLRLTLPPWVPDERAVSAGLVLLLALGIALYAVAGGRAPLAAGGGAPLADSGLGQTQALSAPDAFDVPDEALSSRSPRFENPASPALAAEPTPAPTYVPAPVLEATEEALIDEGAGLLPRARLLAYYGHPHDANMGIVGEHDREALVELLEAEAANYEAADPSRPVVTAFELIATVAQRVPGNDGTYILDTDLATLGEYADFAAERDMLVFLDVQIGRSTVAMEIEKVRPLLERPNVHLALDPEFAVAEGETPGEHIGSIGAESITYAQRTLAQIAQEFGLPPKILIVHQFREDMIRDKGALAPLPGVQLVIDADGYGAPELKTSVYNFLVRDEPVEFAGIKLFYKQDRPLMSAADILALNPSPDVIIYQ